MVGLITLTFSGFPNGYCYPGDPNDLFSDGLNATVVSFNTTTGNLYYNFGDTVPSVDNRVYPWFRTGAGFEDGWYYWNNTYTGWIKAHEVEASDDNRRLYVGSTTDLLTYDGGENAAVTDTTGPFWEVDTDFAARIPMGPGTTAGGTAITVGTNEGADEQNVTLVAAQLPDHYHNINVEGDSSLTPERETDAYLRVGGGLEVDWLAGTGPKNGMGKTYSEINDGTATQTAIDVTLIPPVRGCYIIKRTARIYRFVA